MKTQIRWTPEYDRIIAESLAECSLNLHPAFEMAQKRLMNELNILVSKKAVSSRYYRKFPDLNLLAGDILEERIYKNYMEAHKPWYVRLWSAIQSMLNLNQRL